MMNRNLSAAAVLVAVAALSGCGSSTTGTTAGVTPAATPSSTAPDAMAGMVMSDAPTATTTAPGATAVAGKPTPTQAMVCGEEIRGDVKDVLKLTRTPPTTSTYADALFSCIYTLPMGKMRLSVKHSATDAAALSYAKARRTAVGAAQNAVGLTDHAYQSSAGIVLVVKDNEILEVDTTALPKVFGADQQRRFDLAYEIASDVLGCWTGDDS